MAGDKKRLNANPLALRNITDIAIGDVPENALIPHEGGNYVYKRFTITPVGLIAPADATIDELLEIEEVLGNLETSIQWNIGDWYNRATEQNVWGRKYELQAANEVEYRYQTLADYAWVARSIHFSIRNRKLSFSHHRLVAPLIPELQALWLEYAATRSSKMKVSALKEDMKRLAGRDVNIQFEWLTKAVSLPDERVVHYDEFKPYEPPKDVKQAKQTLTKNASFIADTWENAEMLAPDTRETAIKIGKQQLGMVQEYLRRLGE